MLQLSYDSRSWDKNTSAIPPSQLHPKVLYTLSEKYAGTHESGDPQPKPRLLTWATIQELVKRWALHAVRDYRVKWSKNWTERVLLHLSRMVDKLVH